MKLLRAVGQFWWDFIIGDDWKIAATVVLVLGVAAAVVAALGTDARWLAPVCGGALVLAFVLTFVADNRR